MESGRRLLLASKPCQHFSTSLSAGGIDLSNNLLSGPLPKQIGSLEGMSKYDGRRGQTLRIKEASHISVLWDSRAGNFLVNDNKLTGTVPPEYASLKEIRKFQSNNREVWFNAA